MKRAAVALAVLAVLHFWAGLDRGEGLLFTVPDPVSYGIAVVNASGSGVLFGVTRGRA